MLHIVSRTFWQLQLLWTTITPSLTILIMRQITAGFGWRLHLLTKLSISTNIILQSYERSCLGSVIVPPGNRSPAGLEIAKSPGKPTLSGLFFDYDSPRPFNRFSQLRIISDHIKSDPTFPRLRGFIVLCAHVGSLNDQV